MPSRRDVRGSRNRASVVTRLMGTHSDRACLLFRASLFCFLLYAAAIAAHAQNEPRWEIFTGFSYARLSLGYQSTIFQPTDQNYYGMHVSGSFNSNRYLRIVLCDFGVQTSGTAVNLSPLTTELSTSQVLFGPEFVLRSRTSAPFVHTLVGLTNTRLVSSVNHAYGSYYDEARRTNLAFGLGGGYDMRVTPLITVRAIQADYVPSRLSGTWQNHFRASAGIVFTWGNKQPSASRR